MYLTRSEYDRGVNTFSPEGRLFQVEYALEAIKLGTTAIAVQVNDGVVLAVEKRLTSSLLEAKSVEKIVEVDSHVACAVSGLTADGRTLVEHARVAAQNHRFNYNEPMSLESLTQATCDLALRFGEDDDEEKEGQMSRPFGVALLLVGVDASGPRLYHADPSGTFARYLAKAIGAGSEGAQNHLEEKYEKSMSLQQAEELALQTLEQVMEEKIDDKNVEMAVVRTVDQQYETYAQTQVAAILARLKQ